MSNEYDEMRYIVEPRQPFNFELTCRIVVEFNGREVYGEALDESKYYLALSVDEEVIPLLVSPIKTSLGELLEVDFLVRTSNRVKEECIRVVGRVFDKDLDVKEFYRSVKSDLVLQRVIKRLYGLRSPSTPTVFESFIRAFIEQQMPVAVSNKIASRVIKNFGGSIEIKGVRYYAFPTAEQLAKVDEERLRNCGLSSRKVEYIKNFSNLVLSEGIDLKEISKWDEDRIIHELVKIKGIGRWTAEYVMIRGMHKYASTPIDDLFLRRVISHYYFNGERISRDKVEEICERWGVWKGLASFYLIIDYLDKS